jgi:hypothetical protein
MTHQTGREGRPGGADDAGVDEPDVGQTSREDLGQTAAGAGENGAGDAGANPTGRTGGGPRDDDIDSGHIGESGGPQWVQRQSGTGG